MAERSTPVRFVAMTPDGREHEKRVRSGRVWTHAVALWTPGRGRRVGVVSWHTAEHLAIRASIRLGKVRAPLLRVRSMPALPESQRRTLARIVSKGGEVNGYAGQPGISLSSVRRGARRRGHRVVL